MAVIPCGDEDLAIPLEVIRVAHDHRLSRLRLQRTYVGQIFVLERLPNRHPKLVVPGRLSGEVCQVVESPAPPWQFPYVESGSGPDTSP